MNKEDFSGEVPELRPETAWAKAFQTEGTANNVQLLLSFHFMGFEK